MSDVDKILGVLAEYDSPSEIFHACEETRLAGFKHFDSFTPFPVHNLDKAMGLKPSKLPWIVLAFGLMGGMFAISFMVWASAYDYPFNIGGKPTWSIPAFIPITFEVTILFSALSAVFGMMVLNRMPKFNQPLFNILNFAKVTDDKFFLMIESSDEKFDKDRVVEFLNNTRAKNVIVVEA